VPAAEGSLHSEGPFVLIRTLSGSNPGWEHHNRQLKHHVVRTSAVFLGKNGFIAPKEPDFWSTKKLTVLFFLQICSHNYNSTEKCHLLLLISPVFHFCSSKLSCKIPVLPLVSLSTLQAGIHKLPSVVVMLRCYNGLSWMLWSMTIMWQMAAVDHRHCCAVQASATPLATPTTTRPQCVCTQT